MFQTQTQTQETWFDKCDPCCENPAKVFFVIDCIMWNDFM